MQVPELLNLLLQRDYLPLKILILHSNTEPEPDLLLLNQVIFVMQIQAVQLPDHSYPEFCKDLQDLHMQIYIQAALC